MQTYHYFRPMAFDSHVCLPGKENWLVAPIFRNRDSNNIEESNWRVALRRFKIITSVGEAQQKEHVEIYRFGHWANGWFEIILINPADEEIVRIAKEIEEQLENYPVLDDMDLAQLEAEQEKEEKQEAKNILDDDEDGQ